MSLSHQPETWITAAHNNAFNFCSLCQTEVHGAKSKPASVNSRHPAPGTQRGPQWMLPSSTVIYCQHLAHSLLQDGRSGVQQSFIERQLCASFWARPDALPQRTTSLTSFSSLSCPPLPSLPSHPFSLAHLPAQSNVL